MGRFIGDLIVKVVRDDAVGLFELCAPLGFESNTGLVITVPTGFQTDFCSVPLVPGVYELLGGKYRRSGTIHDHLYSVRSITREAADEMLREMLVIEGAPHVEAEAFFLAVRQWGGSHWG